MVDKDASDELPSSDDLARALRELALVDKVIGLEAEVARLSTQSAYSDARDEIEHLRDQLNGMQASRTWRVGRAVLAPFRVMQRATRWRAR